jgi:hypothetical protein
MEHPQDFFIFDQLGHVFPKRGMAPEDEKRARETIRVFNLENSERLRHIRQKVAKAVAYFLQSDCQPDDSAIDRFLEMVGDVDCISVYFSLLGRRMP